MKAFAVKYNWTILNEFHATQRALLEWEAGDVVVEEEEEEEEEAEVLCSAYDGLLICLTPDAV